MHCRWTQQSDWDYPRAPEAQKEWNTILTPHRKPLAYNPLAHLEWEAFHSLGRLARSLAMRGT